MQHRFGLRAVKVFTAAQQGVDPGQKHSKFERLGDVIVAAHIQAHDDIRLLIGCSQKQERHLGLGADFPAQVKARTVRQRYIQNDKVVPAGLPQLPGLGAGAGRCQRIALFGQRVPYAVAQACVVLHKENLFHPGSPFRLCSLVL